MSLIDLEQTAEQQKKERKAMSPIDLEQTAELQRKKENRCVL